MPANDPFRTQRLNPVLALVPPGAGAPPPEDRDGDTPDQINPIAPLSTFTARAAAQPGPSAPQPLALRPVDAVDLSPAPFLPPSNGAGGKTLQDGPTPDHGPKPPMGAHPGKQPGPKDHKHGPGHRSPETEILTRPVDGTGTNEGYDDWGATHQELLRLAPSSYADGIGEMVSDRPNAREISNAVAQQDGDMPNSTGISDFFWAWGQFIDHDLDLTEAGETEFAPLIAPADDPVFSAGATILFIRVDPVDGSGVDSVRSYENDITAFMDGSQIYGSDDETAAALRMGAYLILDQDGLLEATEDGGVLAGDVRAAENIALTSLHTLFAREHNRWVDELAAENPDLTDDELFDAARMRVEAELQAITYNEWLPILVGEDAIADYQGYDDTVNPGISVEFSTAVFRFGHTLLSADIEGVNEDGTDISAGAIALRDAFFNPTAINEDGGIDPILRGLGVGTAQELDTQVVEDVRSFLFAPTGDVGLDLAAINIQRGRDMGVASYNDLREALGLARAEDWTDITSDEDLADALAGIYGDIDLVDAWVGGLAEDAYGGGLVGELFATIIIDQFERLRDGDAYWSQAVGGLTPQETAELWETTLADVIEANTDIGSIQDDAFFAYTRIGGTDTADDLVGTDGRDLILSQDGDDTLDGGAGDDQLEGGAGMDDLTGGAGDDRLYGGADADTFRFAAGDGHDLIQDFTAEDNVLLDLSGLAMAINVSLTEDGQNVVLHLGDDWSITWVDAELQDVDAGLTIL